MSSYWSKVIIAREMSGEISVAGLALTIMFKAQ